VADFRVHDVSRLMSRVRQVGTRLIKAQPREIVIGNMVRRVLGLIREVSSNDDDGDIAMSDAGTMTPLPETPQRPGYQSSISSFPQGDLGISFDGGSPARRPPIPHSHTSPAPPLVRSTTSLFWFFPQAEPGSQSSTPVHGSPALGSLQAPFRYEQKDFSSIKTDALSGIGEILDEIDSASEQVAEHALTYINSNDTILVQGGSSTIHDFLYAAASKKRKFTVYFVDGAPNNTTDTRNQLLTGSNTISATTDPDEGDSQLRDHIKPLAALGITVVIIPDSAVFAIMSYVNKVLLAPNAVLSTGALLAKVGASNIASAAQAHKVPVLALAGIYKLSPTTPSDPVMLREIGDAGALGGSDDLWEGIEVVNPLWDLVQATKVNLYITNL
jgi:translation initiation factor eIF-2B subunit beta